MAKFTATIRVFDVEAPNQQAARKQVEAHLASNALGRCQVVGIEPAAVPLPVRRPNPPVRPKWWNTALGPLLLLGALAWTLWFYWLLFE